MNIMILGSGAREYAIALALIQENKNIKLFFSPGNGATSYLGINIDIKDLEELAIYAKKEKIDFCIVGSEDFLANGVVDIFKKKDIAIFGPSQKAARLESSKAFMKEFLKENNIKTAKFLNTNNINEASIFINSLIPPIVIKADGLCAGKGVIIAKNHKEAIDSAKDMLDGVSFKDAGKRIIIEEFLDGFELSVFAVCDGDDFILLPVAQDHKKLKDNDQGPNTGGMGAYAPSPLANEELLTKVKNHIIIPTLKGMKAKKTEFCGVLFIGLMIVDNEPYVLEFNVRFGDPECEVLMPLIENPLELLKASVEKKLKNFSLKLRDCFAVCVICASKNYPFASSPKTKIKISNIPHNSHICYAAVDRINDELYTNGGRIMACVGLGKDIKSAKNIAYELCDNIYFDGKQYRKDIAMRVLK